jgi:hypothetical protein
MSQLPATSGNSRTSMLSVRLAKSLFAASNFSSPGNAWQTIFHCRPCFFDNDGCIQRMLGATHCLCSARKLGTHLTGSCAPCIVLGIPPRVGITADIVCIWADEM